MPDNLRDWAIVILAVIAIIQSLFWIVLLAVLIRVFLQLKSKTGPILDSVTDTMATVRGTSSFVSDTVVKPIIKVASFAAGVRRTLAVISRLSGRRRGKQHG